MNQLKLFMWGKIIIGASDYMIFALAYSETEAKKMILDNTKTEHTRNLIANYMYQNQCTVHDEPCYFAYGIGNQLLL